jgi:hypothetical protein
MCGLFMAKTSLSVAKYGGGRPGPNSDRLKVVDDQAAPGAHKGG